MEDTVLVERRPAAAERVAPGLRLAQVIGERLIQAGAPIKIIHEFRVPSQVWIASAKADSGSVKAFRNSLLLMRDVDMQSAIDVDLTGFAPASLSDFDQVKEVLE